MEIRCLAGWSCTEAQGWDDTIRESIHGHANDLDRL